MPKEIKGQAHPHRISPLEVPHQPSRERAAAIWSNSDDEVLITARASGLNWQPIAARHFPTKTANACRKRHERLMERRHVEDWDAEKLETLAREYMAVRKDMWEMLANRLGEKWQVIEAKCMEKGFKPLRAIARTAQRRTTTDLFPSSEDQEQSGEHHDHDSGISLGSDAEMEVGKSDSIDRSPKFIPGQITSTGHQRQSYNYTTTQSMTRIHDEQQRPRSLPQPFPLYRPPHPIAYNLPSTEISDGLQPAPQKTVHHLSLSRRSSGDLQRNGLSIQAMLSPCEPQGVCDER